jgi:hypothetical protein
LTLKNQIVGLVRFSYISKGGFAHSHDPQDDQERMIFDADRMERRFVLFEKLALRSLCAQTDQDFRCIFLISKSFPKHYRDRLEMLVSTLQGGVVMEKPFMPQFRAIRSCYDALRDETYPYFTSFRLDDDDMLDLDFIQRLRRLAVPAARIKDDGEPVVLAFNKGLYLEISDQENRIFDARERTPLSVGTAMITKTGNSGKNIYSRNHRKLPAFFNTYSEVSAPAWLRTIHQDNDSVPEFTGNKEEHSDAEIDAQLRDCFGISRAELMKIRP